ncbi:MAG: hypothetical protein LBI56_02515 [Puniceicoccales bacterium]|jgi:hypothetical protein|nr:hypothetical protein [Puniceicoccales bacterium]
MGRLECNNVDAYRTVQGTPEFRRLMELAGADLGRWHDATINLGDKIATMKAMFVMPGNRLLARIYIEDRKVEETQKKSESE